MGGGSPEEASLRRPHRDEGTSRLREQWVQKSWCPPGSAGQPENEHDGRRGLPQEAATGGLETHHTELGLFGHSESECWAALSSRVTVCFVDAARGRGGGAG